MGVEERMKEVIGGRNMESTSLLPFLAKAASACLRASCPDAENVFLPQLQLKKVLEGEMRFGKNA